MINYQCNAIGVYHKLTQANKNSIKWNSNTRCDIYLFCCYEHLSRHLSYQALYEKISVGSSLNLDFQFLMDYERWMCWISMT